MVSRRFSLLRIFVAIKLDKSNYDYVNDYKILMYMLISFGIRDYLNLPLHSPTAPIFYTYINVFEILVASATLIVNIFILRQYVRQESRDMPRLFDDADYNSGICSMQFESTSGSLSRRLFHPTFLLSPFPHSLSLHRASIMNLCRKLLIRTLHYLLIKQYASR